MERIDSPCLVLFCCGDSVFHTPAKDSRTEMIIGIIAFCTGNDWSELTDDAQGYALKSEAEYLSSELDPRADVLTSPAKDGNYIIALTDKTLWWQKIFSIYG